MSNKNAKLDDVARMSDTELTHALRRLIRSLWGRDLCRDPQDAMRLIEAMGRRGFTVDMGNSEVGFGWCVLFDYRCKFSEWSKSSFSDKRKLAFPRAVSEAALRALRARAASKLRRSPR